MGPSNGREVELKKKKLKMYSAIIKFGFIEFKI